MSCLLFYVGNYYWQAELINKVPAWYAHFASRGKYLVQATCLTMA